MWERTRARQRGRSTGWVYLCVALMAVEGAALAAFLGQRHREELKRAHAGSARVLEHLPDWYAPQQGRRLRIQPLQIAIYGTPTRTNTTAP